MQKNISTRQEGYILWEWSHASDKTPKNIISPKTIKSII